MSILDDLWSWLTTSPGTAAGGSAGGTPYLGPASPTGSTQTPPAVATAPALGGPPVSQGLLAGLLGGQQPANPMSYFMPRQGLLGNSPLGMGLRGGLAGLAAGAGVGGLSGLGVGAMGGQQEEMQRRQNQMQQVLSGQQYQQGQQALVGGAINMQFALDRANIIRRRLGQPELTMADLINNPMLAASPAAAQTATAVPSGTPAPPGTPTVGAMGVPIVPTAPGVNPNVASAYGVSPVAGMSGSDIVKQYPNAIDAPRDVQDQAAIAFYRKYGGAPWRASQPQGTPVDPVPPASMTDDQIRSRLAPIMARESAGQNVPNAQGGPASGYYQFLPGSWQEAVQLAYPGTGGQGQRPTMAPTTAGQTQQPAVAAPPDAVEQGYQQQIDDALASGDLKTADEAQTKLAEYQAAAQQKAKETAAVGATTYGGQQAGYERAIKIHDDYQSNSTVKTYAIAKPAADAFEQAYQSRGQPGGSSDYALVEAALQVLNPGVPVAKPGTADYATQLQTLPGKVAESIQKAISTNSAIDQGPVDQLKRAVEQRMAINNKLIASVNKSFADRAKRDAPQIDPSYWNPEGWGLEPVPAPAQAQGIQTAVATVKNDDDYKALPSGALYVGPDGITRKKP